MQRTKLDQRKRIHKRIRKSIKGTQARPRLVVYRSNKAIYCQLVNDDDSRTIASVSSMAMKLAGNKTAQAKEVGKALAAKAAENNVENVVFDRNGYLYHGRVKALADGAREGGLKF